MNVLRNEMTQYYTSLRADRIAANAAYHQRKQEIWQAMDQYETTHPNLPACLLKAKLIEEISERFDPILFPHNPFFFEMGVRYAESWGTPYMLNAGSWLIEKRNQKHFNSVEWQNIRTLSCSNPETPWKLWNIWNVFDTDHHCLGYTKLLNIGVEGVIAKIQEQRKTGCDVSQLAFLEAAERSCQALLKCAVRFADKAEALLQGEKDPTVIRNLKLISSAARHVPAKPPRNFHEGLASLLFLREATASLENIGVSVLGHVDRLLGKLLQQDLITGTITTEEAKDLLGRWMLFTDVKFHVEDSNWPETSTCIELGGCDENGHPVFNEVTRLLIETHRAHHLINPKLNCRYGSNAPDAYVQLLANHAAEGHNAFAFLNDDVLIPAGVRAGKTEREARLYVNGGCQETIVEGVEHSAGAYYYFNLARLLDLQLNPESAERSGAVGQVLAEPCEKAADFEEFYATFISALARAIQQGGEWLRLSGQGWSETHPCPLFSVGLTGCLESARDYTAGGAKYNTAALALVGFGTVVDSLNAIRLAVYEQSLCSLSELRKALAGNWQEAEPLRLRLAALPKFGHGDEETDRLAARLGRDIALLSRPMRNERGGPFQASFFAYYFFLWMGKDVRATPDGRHASDWLSQGVSPGRVKPAQNLTDIMRGVCGIDLKDFPANAVLDLQLPMAVGGSNYTTKLSAAMRTFASLGGATLQTNVVSVDALRDAKRHPEHHQDLVVRISGLSAKFVCLIPEIQDEIIARNIGT